MTKIREQFFKEFEIEPITILNTCVYESYRCKYPGFDKKCCDCEYYHLNKKYYLQITADVLLKLICILNNFTDFTCILNGENVEEIKDEILLTCINYKNEQFFKEEVQELFK